MALFELGVANIAQYHWGSLRTRFNLAAFDKRCFNAVLASYASGIASWDSAAQFRSHVAFNHELVHYFQDISTGVGHWDEFARNQTLGYLFRWVQAMPELDATTPEDAGEKINGYIQRDKARVTDALLFVPQQQLSSNSLQKLADSLAEANDGQRFPEQQVAHFTVEAIMEGEAIATVLAYITELQMTSEQRAIMEDNVALMNPRTNDGRYTGAISEVNHVLMHLQRTSFLPESILRPERIQGWARILFRLAAFLFDLSLAHPSEDLLEESGRLPTVYHPGTKLVHLLRAIPDLSDKDFEHFFLGVLSGDYQRAEELLLNSCRVSYPRSTEVYKRWSQFWKTPNKFIQHDDTVASFRAMVAKRRSEHPEKWSRKTIGTMMENALCGPAVWTTDEAYFSWGQDEIREPEEFGKRFTDAADAESLWDTVRFFLQGRAILCPHARMCRGFKPNCITGIKDLLTLPRQTVCRLRGLLDYNGLKLGGEMVVTSEDLEFLESKIAVGVENNIPKAPEAPALVDHEVIRFIAEKIVLSIVAGFVKDSLYAAWRAIKSKSQAAQAKKEIEGATASPNPAIPEDQIVNDLVPQLMEEGLSHDTSVWIVRSSIDLVRDRIKKQYQARDTTPES
jgi:type IV secretory pathway protease TraF